MYRCVTELKGLIIDVDSFTDFDIEIWLQLNRKFRCAFLTYSLERKKKLEKNCSGSIAIFLPSYVKNFMPNYIHIRALEMLNLNATEVAYISGNRRFINNALGFMSGVIWVTEEDITYGDISNAPDIICSSLEQLVSYFAKDVKGFIGEKKLFPQEKYNKGKGILLISHLDLDEEEYPLIALGRYFGYSHYMNQLHPYSAAIYLNKNYGGKAYGVFDEKFYSLYSLIIDIIINSNKEKIDAICSVPARPGQRNRFKWIIESLAHEFHLDDLTDDFVCIQNYPSQKSGNQFEREENIKNRFTVNKSLEEKNIIIIDDIISTGSTMKECIKTLKNYGANLIYAIVLGVNQIKGNYYSSDVAEVKCPVCQNKMRLLVNSKTLDFFYSCVNHHTTLSFQEGRKQIIENVNKKVQYRDNDDEI